MGILGYVGNFLILIFGGVLSLFSGINALRFGLKFLGGIFTTSAGDPEPIVISMVPYVTIPGPGVIFSFILMVIFFGLLGLGMNMCGYAIGKFKSK